MDFNTLLALLLIGMAAGVLGGFIGVGGGVIIVPGLVFFLGLSQHAAQGTSLTMMLPPIAILAVMNYYKAGQVNIKYGMILAGAFVIGAYFGSKLSLKLPPEKVKFFFGVFMLVVAIRMVLKTYKHIL